MGLEKKVAFVTGAARGQGRSHAQALGRAGADVIAVDICEQIDGVTYPMPSEEDLEETRRLVEETGARALAIRADARDSEAIKAAAARGAEHFGGIDIAAINHGISIPAAWDRVSEQVWDLNVEGNLTSVWRATQAAIPFLIERGGGAIAITSSAAGLVGVGAHVAYTSAKHGAIGMMRALAIELAPLSIRVNAICPGNVATPMLHNQGLYELFAGEGATQEDMIFPAEACHLLPVPWVPPETISDALLYLVSDSGRFVTGVALPVDAGMSHQAPGMGAVAAQRIAELEAD